MEIRKRNFETNPARYEYEHSHDCYLVDINDLIDDYFEYKLGGKRVIRSGCFETNSSSQHSIVVTKDNSHIKIKRFDYTSSYEEDDNQDCEYVYLGKDGKMSLYDVEYGYGREPFKVLSKFIDKLKYAMCAYLGDFYGDEPRFDEEYNRFINLVKDIVPGFEEFYTHNRDVEIYTDEDGNELSHDQIKYDHYDVDNDKYVYLYKDDDGNEKQAKLSDEYYEVPAIGPIDHQSSGLLQSFLKKKGITLKEFLTNKRYIIIVTGDEYDDWPTLKNSGLIDKNFIVEEYGA